MYPVLFEFSGIMIASWHVLFALGGVAAWFLYRSLAKIHCPAWSEGRIDGFFVALYLAGYFGSRGFSILVEDGVRHPLSFITQLFQFGSMTLYGGILAVTVVVLGASRLWKVPLRSLALILVGPGLLAIGLGRIGCFLNGDDYGRPLLDQTSAPWWAMPMPNLEDGLARYPVQLSESLLCLLVGTFVCLQVRKGPKVLWPADLGIVAYALGRFVIEFFRGDERGLFLGSSLSTSQGISLLALAAWIIYRFVDHRRIKTMAGSH